MIMRMVTGEGSEKTMRMRKRTWTWIGRSWAQCIRLDFKIGKAVHTICAQAPLVTHMHMHRGTRIWANPSMSRRRCEFKDPLRWTRDISFWFSDIRSVHCYWHWFRMCCGVLIVENVEVIGTDSEFCWNNMLTLWERKVPNESKPVRLICVTSNLALTVHTLTCLNDPPQWPKLHWTLLKCCTLPSIGIH